MERNVSVRIATGDETNPKRVASIVVWMNGIVIRKRRRKVIGQHQLYKIDGVVTPSYCPEISSDVEAFVCACVMLRDPSTIFYAAPLPS